MMVKQKYSDMILEATEKLREIDAQTNKMMGLDRYDRPVPVFKTDIEALMVLHAMKREYTEKKAMLKLMQLLTDDHEEVMDEIFSAFD